MITKVLNEDVFTTDCKHIAFAVNTKGFNDSGFAGQVCSRYAPEFANTGEKKLGDLVSVKADEKTFHGLVCHSLEVGGWDNAPSAITETLNKIEADEPIAVVLMGAGMIGRMSGADVIANVKAIHQSEKKIILHSLEFSEKAIFDVLK